MATDDLKADVSSFLNDGTISDRAKYFAGRLGLSPKAFLDAQLKRINLPSLGAMREQQAQPVSTNSNVSAGDIRDEAQGFMYLQQNLGFPRRGAAYLASAISHESSWDGARQWPGVQMRDGGTDGTNRNGGLISWASWSNNSARLGQIEKHFGRNISQISEQDQLAYMQLEMQRSYKSAYRTFMNPNASSSDLQEAVVSYWGFHPDYLGNRWVDAERLMNE